MHRKMSTSLLATLFWILAASGYGQTIDKELALAYDSEVIVQQGGVTVTLTDFMAFFEDHFSEGDRANLLTDVSQVADILSSLVRNEWVFQQSIEAGMIDDPVMQARLRRAVLNRLGTLYRDQFIAGVQLDDYSVRAREIYLANPEQFRGVPTYDFEHILIAVGPTRTEVEAMELVLAAYRRLSEGEVFHIVASEFSDDDSAAANNHTYEDVNIETLVAPLASVLRNSANGELADPVRSQFGWHIARLVRTHEAEVLPWELVRDRAIEQARTEHLSRAWRRQLREAQSQPAVFPPGAIRRLLAAYGIDALSIDMQQLADELEP